MPTDSIPFKRRLAIRLYQQALQLEPLLALAIYRSVAANVLEQQRAYAHKQQQIANANDLAAHL